MSTVASKNDTLKNPYVLTADDLRKLHETFQIFGYPITYDVSCSDGLKREFTDVNELLRYENPPNRKIKSITVCITSVEPTKATYPLMAVVTFGQHEIHVSIKWIEETLLKFDAAFQERLSGMRPWYAPLAMINFAPSKLMAILLALLYGAAVYKPGAITLANDVTTFLAVAISILGIAFLIFVGGNLLAFLNHLFFPKAVFAIGQGAKRHDDKEKIRWGIIISFLISIVSGWVLLYV